MSRICYNKQTRFAQFSDQKKKKSAIKVTKN